MTEEQKPKGIVSCKACGKDVAKSAKVCPHCGKKLKMGMMLKLFLGVVGIAILASVLSPSTEDLLKELQSAQVSDLSPRGELYETFKFNSDFTDLNREDKEKAIKGMVVEWSLPVYEVRKLGENKYKVQTSGSDGIVGTFVTFPNVPQEDIETFNTLKTGDFVNFKGKITGTFMRNIEIEPAILLK